jgi:hypothetical protein
MLNALMIASAAVSLQAAAPNEIVVIGQKPMDRSQVQKAVNAVSSHDFQMARYHDPVCPLVVGLSDDMRTVVEGQMRDIMTQVGAPVARGKCTANLIVMVAGDVNALFADVRRSRPMWFSGLAGRQIDAIAAQKGPVRAWSVSTLRNEDGENVTPHLDGSEKRSLRVRSASIMKQTTRQQLDGSIILIEQSALKGRTLGEISQFFVMQGLAVTHAPADGNVPTILRTFQDASAPRGLTSFDLGYLKALYSGDGRDSGVKERSRIARAIAQPNG